MTTTQAAVSSPVQAYREKMFALLGDRDPMQVMGETAAKLAEIVKRNSATVLRTRPFPGKWTPNEVIGHLTDTEWVYGYRLRVILSEDEPTILGTQQDEWVTALRYNEHGPHELVETFGRLRELNLATWRRTSAEDRKRVGRHNERGEEALETMLRLLGGHDLNHLGQIERYLQAIHERE